jgi:hypothetical protein
LGLPPGGDLLLPPPPPCASTEWLPSKRATAITTITSPCGSDEVMPRPMPCGASSSLGCAGRNRDESKFTWGRLLVAFTHVDYCLHRRNRSTGGLEKHMVKSTRTLPTLWRNARNNSLKDGGSGARWFVNDLDRVLCGGQAGKLLISRVYELPYALMCCRQSTGMVARYTCPQLPVSADLGQQRA